MIKPEFPVNEGQRLRALYALSLLDSEPEAQYDRITRIVQHVFNVPIALVSLIDEKRQWFKSHQGLDVPETPRDISFCGHAILQDDILCISNTLDDQRFFDNPLVCNNPNIRFYAGAPLKSPEGLKIGTLCVIDSKPHEPTEQQLKTLRDLADCVEELFKHIYLMQAVQILGEHENYVHTILDTVAEGIVTLSDEGIIQTINPATERMFLANADQLCGKHIDEIIPNYYTYQGSGKTGMELDQVSRVMQGRRLSGEVFPIEVSVTEMLQRGRTNLVAAIRDITQRKNTERRLQEATRLRQAILDGANFSIISTDTDGVIRTFNVGAQRLLGYDEDEVIGKATPEIIHDKKEVVMRAAALTQELGVNVEPGFEAFIAKAKLGLSDEMEWTYIRKNGTRFPVLLSVTALRDDNHNITGYLGIAGDITERKKVERMKSEFVSMVSHELRTPLTSIRGSLGLIMGKFSNNLPEKVKQLVDTADRNSIRLSGLINDILDIEKIAAGKMEFEFERINLLDTIKLALQANEGYAMKHRVQLQYTYPDAPIYVNADESRLLQVFANLLSNAIKFSSIGDTVDITIEMRDEYVRVNVIDHGCGIPEEFSKNIFERFAQADSSDTRQKGGTGLGLNITKAIIDKHNGHIGYVSGKNVGTTFYFDLLIIG